MVFFTCNSCGTSLKKNQVDKHVFQCRCTTVSCHDCQKDFGIKEYGAHIKCITETEKYGGAGWKAPTNFNKGEKKQQAWVDTVNDTLKKGSNTLTPACKSLLQAISKHDNVPRKKVKFLNFVKNIAKNRFDERTIENVWNVIEEQWKSQAEAIKAASGGPATANNSKNKDAGKENNATSEADGESNEATEAQEDDASKENGDVKLSKREKKEARRQKQNKEEKKQKKTKNSISEEDKVEDGQQEVSNGHKESKKDKKKRKRVESASELEKKKTRSENGDEEVPEDPAGEEGDDEDLSPGDFKWGSIIKQILEKQPDHEISMKKLKKKVFSEYYAVVGDSKGNKTPEELVSKLNKKLRKQQFKVIRDTVRLVE